jgi:hypothetical protein
MSDETLEKIKLFLQQGNWNYIDTKTVSSSTKIEKDLMLTGDDAVEFIIHYGKLFSVDVSNFKINQYFEPEGMNWLLPKTVPNKKILTVGDLEKGIIAGKLEESVING